MTLNITILDSRTIYQSADYRITDLKTGDLILDTSNKIVIVSYLNWSGSITYTGLGMLVNGTHVSSILADWLESVTNVTMDQLADHICRSATKWFTRLFGGERHLRHTFVLAGFDGTYPKAFIVSNFERWEGLKHDVSRAFEVSVVSSANAKVIVTGCKPAMPRLERRLLEREVRRHGDEPARVRRLIQAANNAAALSPLARGIISPDCEVVSFDAFGSARNDRPEGKPGGVIQLMSGLNLQKMTQQIPGSKHVSHRILTSGNSLRRPKHGTKCSARLVDTESGYAATILSNDTGLDLFARALSDCGHIAAEGPLTVGGLPMPWVFRNGKWVLLEVPTGAFGYAWGVNARGDVVGGCVTREAGNIQHAWFWSVDGVSKELDSRVDHESLARSINVHGDIAGHIRTGFRQEHSSDTVPTIWHSGSGQSENLELEPGDCGESIAIADTGAVLVRLGNIPARWRAGRWVANTSSTINAPLGFIPVGLDTTGTYLLALMGTSPGSEAVLVLPSNERILVRCPPGGRPSCVNQSGTVAGLVTMDGFWRPWVTRMGEAPRLLPYLPYHNTMPASIDGDGNLVGTSSADHGCHSIIWTVSG